MGGAYLSLFQNAVVRKEVIANYVLSNYELPFRDRLGNALNAGWQYFLKLLITLAHLWIFLLLGVVSFIAYRKWQQKRKLVIDAGH